MLLLSNTSDNHRSPAEEIATAYAQVAAQAARGLLPIASRTFPLADVDRAWQRQSSGPGGKIVVTLP